MADNNDRGASIALVRSAAGLPAQWSDERIVTIWKMAAPQANSPVQFAAFMAICNRYGFDPLLGEAWFGEVEGKPSVITGRDSFLKKAQEDPGYLGYDADVVREKDEFEVIRSGADIQVSHRKIGFDRGDLLGAYCVVYHKDRRPTYFEAHFEDYAHLHGKRNWKKNPSDMVLTRAITTAHRLMFKLSGVYTPADGGSEPGEQLETGRLDDLNAALTEDDASEIIHEAEIVEGDRPLTEEEEYEAAMAARDGELGL